MSNFKFLLSAPGFALLAEVAIAAENGGGSPTKPRQTGIVEKSLIQEILGEVRIWIRLIQPQSQN